MPEREQKVKGGNNMDGEEKVKPEEKWDEGRELELNRLIGILDNIVEKKYGIGIKDSLHRIDKMNSELGQVIETVGSIEENMVTKKLFEAEIRNLVTKTESVDKRVDDWRDSTKMYFTVLGGVTAIVGVIAPIIISLIIVWLTGGSANS